MLYGTPSVAGWQVCSIRRKPLWRQGGWYSGKAVQRYLHLYDDSMKEAAERLATLKPNRTATKPEHLKMTPLRSTLKVLKLKAAVAQLVEQRFRNSLRQGYRKLLRRH